MYVSVCMCVTERHSPQVLDGSFDALQYDRSLFTPTQCLSVKTRERKRGKDGGRVAKRGAGREESGCFNEGGGQTVVGQERIVVK